MANVTAADNARNLDISEDIAILNNVTVSSLALAESALTLTAPQKTALAYASVHGRIMLRLQGSSVTGSPDFTYDSLMGSFDGTNYRVLQYFSPITVDSAEEEEGPEITVLLPANLSKLKLDASVTTLDGSNKLVVYAALRLEL